MAAAPHTDDRKALAVILECLRYAERELRLLKAPMLDVADMIEQIVSSVERRIDSPSAVSCSPLLAEKEE